MLLCLLSYLFHWPWGVLTICVIAWGLLTLLAQCVQLPWAEPWAWTETSHPWVLLYLFSSLSLIWPDIPSKKAWTSSLSLWSCGTSICHPCKKLLVVYGVWWNVSSFCSFINASNSSSVSDLCFHGADTDISNYLHAAGSGVSLASGGFFLRGAGV